jgi:L-2,4-diaminobutyrate decarboxylase
MPDLLKKAYDPGLFRQQGHHLVDLLADYLTTIKAGDPSLKVLNYVAPDELYQHWQTDLAKGPQPEMDEFFKTILHDTIHMHHPKYMGHQTSNVAPAAALAGLAGGLLDPGMGVYEQGTAGVVFERLIAEALGREMGWGETAEGFLTSGGTLGNLTAMLCARQVMAEGDVWENGLAGKQHAFMASSEAHYSVGRAAKVMGMGSRGVVPVPVNGRFQMDTSQLEECFDRAENDGVKIIGVVASSCATATGSYDPIDEIAGFCEAKKTMAARGWGAWRVRPFF